MGVVSSHPFTVEEWTLSGSTRVEMLAEVANYAVACGAYQAAVALRPKGRIMLRNGIRTVMDSEEERKRRAAGG